MGTQRSDPAGSSAVAPEPWEGAGPLARYRQFLALIPTAASLCDAEGIIVAYNDRAAELWGQAPPFGDPQRRFSGAYRLFSLDGDPMTAADAPVAGALRTGRPVRDAEMAFGRPDGSRVFVQVNVEPLRDAGGRIIGALNCFVDVTARRRAEDEAQRSQRELEDFFDSAAVAIRRVAADGTILRANQAELDLLGYTAEEYVGHHIAEFHADNAVIEDILDRIRRGEQLKGYEARLRAKDGSIRHVLISSNVLFRDGRLHHTRCFTIDITVHRDVERRLELAKAAGGVGTFDRNFARDTVDVSDTYWGLFGVGPHGFGTTYRAGWLSRVHPEDRDRVRQDLRRSLATGIYETEYRTVWPNGEVHWLHTRGHTERGADGEPLRLIGAIVDITERKRAEEELRQRETELRLIADSVPALIAYIDKDLRYRFVNRGYQTRFGRPRDEIVGLHVRDLVGSEGYEALVPHLERVLRGETVHFETCLPGQDEPFDVEVDYLPRFAEDGAVVGFYAFVNDITERRRGEMALRAHAAELEAVMETVPAAVWLTHNREATYIVGSRYASRLFRAQLGENLSLTPRGGGALARWHYRRNGADIPIDQAPLRRAARGEVVTGEELELTFPDGTSVPLLVNAAPILDARGQPSGAVAAAMDISERKRNEERQQLIMAELDHRVRNTLASIRSMLAIAAPAGAPTRAFVQVIAGRIDAMAHAHGLLTESGWQGARLRKLAADELAPHASAGAQRIRLAGPDLMLRPTAAVSMALTIHELMTNAAKYGALSVPEGRVSLSWSCEGEGVERLLRLAWVESGGPAVRSPSSRGFGSRLIEGALAHEFGAEVRMDYAATGLRFDATVRFDRIAIEAGDEDGADERPVAAAPATAQAATPARVLLIEDDVLIALQLQQNLENVGMSVLGPAARLQQALRLAALERFDVAVLDVNLGGEQVFPVADLLAGRGIPFLFLTGYEARTILPGRFGNVPALQKPVTEATLIEAVRRLSGSSSVAAE